MNSPREAIKGLYRRGNIYWFRQQINGKRHSVSLETGDLTVALDKIEELRTGNLLEPGTLLAHSVDRYIRYNLDRGDWTLSTERSKGYVLKRFADHLGKLTPTQVTPDRLKEWYNHRMSERSKTTAYGNLMTVRGFFRWCVEEEKTCRENPVLKLDVKAPPTAARQDFCTPELRDKLIEECTREDLKFVLYCGFHAGLRFNEIVEAKATWFDLEAGLLHLRKHAGMQFKNREERTIPMTLAFKEFIRAYGLREPYMLHPEIPARRKNVYRWDFGLPFDTYMKAKGVEWVTPHIMRHTFASLLVSANVNVFKVSKWIGDSVKVVDKHYAHLIPNDPDIERSFAAPVAPPVTPPPPPRKSASSKRGTRRNQKE